MWKRPIGLAFAAAALVACSKDHPHAPTHPADAGVRPPREVVTEAPKRSVPYRAKIGHAELYIPTWFSAHHGAYDLVVHFHGVGKLQEDNFERCHLDAAVVSINLGVSTDVYTNAFREPEAFSKLITDAEEEIQKSGFAPGAHVGRIALSAWSAGFVSVAKIMSQPANAAKVDAIVLADGFFSSFTNLKKRTINTAFIEPFVEFAKEAVARDKVFAITHTAIPTTGYPSVAETVGKLLELTSISKNASSAVGPGSMREMYTADSGNFHVKGYAGVKAGDHIKQIRAMGETLYPYLKMRWERFPDKVAP